MARLAQEGRLTSAWPLTVMPVSHEAANHNLCPIYNSYATGYKTCQSYINRILLCTVWFKNMPCLIFYGKLCPFSRSLPKSLFLAGYRIFLYTVWWYKATPDPMWLLYSGWLSNISLYSGGIRPSQTPCGCELLIFHTALLCWQFISRIWGKRSIRLANTSSWSVGWLLRNWWRNALEYNSCCSSILLRSFKPILPAG